jgi:ABC-2 type transport system ATP-binding protein/sodium transport system ATP-binding protein
MIGVHELVKRFYSGSREVLAVDRLSFTVHPAEVYGLLGPNGAGKTTTVRMVIGLLQPDAGFAEVGGFRSSTAPDEVKCRVGLVSTENGLYPWLSARELLLFFADLYGVRVSLARERIEQLSALLQLDSFIDRRCITLSSGQKQRVTLARALIHDPPVMLLDEPTRGLDVIGSQVVFEYIGHLRERGKAIIVCTHRLDEAQRLCDRFGLLHQGRLRHEGSLEQLREETGFDSLVEMFTSFVEMPATNCR